MRKILHSHSSSCESNSAEYSQAGSSFAPPAPVANFPRVSVGYFANWDIYDRKYKPQNVSKLFGGFGVFQ